MYKKLAIIGAGEMGAQAYHYAQVDGRYEVIGFIDDTKTLEESIYGLPILGKIEDIDILYKKGLFDCLFIGLGYKHLQFKKKLHDNLSNRIPFANIIANPTYIDCSVQLGDDIIIYPGCILDKNVMIHDNTVLNIGAIVSHDSIIGNSCFIGVKTAISGFCKIGECCFMGTSTTIIDHVNICDNVLIGASSLVLHDIKEEGIYLGAPVKKTNN